MGNKDKDNCGISGADIERGFLETDQPVPPMKITDEFGTRDNWERMDFDHDTGKMEDRYCGGFVKRGISDDDEDD